MTDPQLRTMWRVALVILAASLWPSLGYRSRVRRERNVKSNIAFEKPAFMISQGGHRRISLDPSKAVDGKHGTYWESGTCAHSSSSHEAPWWMVFLLDLYNVTSVFLSPVAGAVRGSCGRRVDYIQDKIGGLYHGDHARPGQFPWATRMVIGRGKCEHICGATLINSKWLITAEHCTRVRKNRRGECITGSKIKTKRQMRKVTIVAGTVTIHENEPTRRNLKIANIMRHPSEDLALLELKEPVQLNDYIQPACLPRGGIKLGDGQKGTLAGWGTDTIGEIKVADRLQFAEFEKKDQAFCEEQWKRENFSVRTCFGGEDRAKAYSGDSGSGIGWENAGVFTLDGIYLSGSSDKGANYKKTGIFVDVSKYLPWIFKTMKWKS